jgi:hypothetical protein
LRHCITIIIAACLLSIPIRSWASNLFADVGVETRYVQGDSAYYISGVDPALGSWASELEFPLNNFMAGVRLYVGSSHEENPRQVKVSSVWSGLPLLMTMQAL